RIGLRRRIAGVVVVPHPDVQRQTFADLPFVLQEKIILVQYVLVPERRVLDLKLVGHAVVVVQDEMPGSSRRSGHTFLRVADVLVDERIAGLEIMVSAEEVLFEVTEIDRRVETAPLIQERRACGSTRRFSGITAADR